MIYLYVKTHNNTGLKYLGKTQQTDPHLYKGSGKYWGSHCSKHGYDYTTDILFQSESIEEIREKGIYYSNLWNIVESAEWANLTTEEGTGGSIVGAHTPEANAKRSNTLKGRKLSEEHRKKLSDANKGHPDYRSTEIKKEAARKASLKLKGRILSEEHKARIGAASLGRIQDERAREKMKAAWTPERKEAQRERTQKHNQNRPILVCPHCKKEGTNSGNMNRYHFEKCSTLLP